MAKNRSFATKKVKRRASDLKNSHSEKFSRLSLEQSEVSVERQKSRISLSSTKFTIVGIGASAGGLEAIEAFFQQMDPQSGMAFVLVQHLDPTHKSILSELVGRFSTMPVQEVTQSIQVEPNHVYVIPPNRDLAILNNRLQLLDPTGPRHLRLSIDYFFRSLAQEARDSAVGIVLSGTGTDGTLGIRAIKGEGGLVLVQDPATAAYDGMPRSAIATGLADAILQPAEMARQLLAYARNATFPQSASSGLQPEGRDDRERLFVLLRSQTGYDFSLYKEATISRRIQRRMTINGIDNETDFVKLLQQSPAEVDALWKEFLIRVTQFFRDSEVFELLGSEIIPELLKSKSQNDEIRIWVPACSTGEEAYSIAMLIYESLEKLGEKRDIQIFATDIDQAALDIARAGIYPESIVSDVSKERLSRFFSKNNNSYVVVGKELRRLLVFSSHDVIKDPPFSRIDLVSCRNLLIYMRNELQSRVLGLFHYALNETGFLVLGGSETTSAAQGLFTEYNRKLHLYQQKPKSVTGQHLPYPGFFYSTGLGGVVKGAKSRTHVPTLREITENALLEIYAPTCVVVDDSGNMLYVHGQTGRYLEATTGEANLNITRLARRELSIHLSAALREASASKAEVCYRSLRLDDHGQTLSVDLRVRPLSGSAAQRSGFLVLFEEADLRIESTERTDLPTTDSALVERTNMLEQELASTREVLQTANEELQTSNEELSSTVEELQSTNEELLTSQEELRSVNEELLTVNAELEGKLDQLAEANADKENLLASTDVGTIFLDLEKRIKWFSPSICKMVYLIEGDIGRPIAHISHRLENLDFAGLVEQVLETLTPIAREVRDDEGNWYDLRINLYRTAVHAVAGTVVTLSDINELKRSRESALFRDLLESSPDATVIVNDSGKVFMINKQAEKLFGWSSKELIGRPVEVLLPADSRRKHRQHREMFMQTPRIRTMAAGNGLSCVDKNGREFLGQISLSPITTETGVLIYAAIRDISAQLETESVLRRINGIYQCKSYLEHLERQDADGGSRLLESLCRKLVREAGYAQCWISLNSVKGNPNYTIVADAGFPKGSRSALDPKVLEMLCSNKVKVIRDVYAVTGNEALQTLAQACKSRSLACFPLRKGKRILGVLGVHARESTAFQEMEVDSLRALSKQLVCCLAE
ncbi:MAG: PAS domain S-box protein [Gammaproteobacteria bacterium]|nr:PAS domain S-box protein [Gammaproteobacteria bacterium]